MLFMRAVKQNRYAHEGYIGDQGRDYSTVVYCENFEAMFSALARPPAEPSKLPLPPDC